jgi:cation transport regulator ChaB
MPWKTTHSLPEAVRNALPVAAQQIWMKAANSALKDHDEEAAAKIAWAAVKSRYRKSSDNKWVAVEKVELQAEVKKLDDELRVVWGWASVIEENGQVVIDKQGDVISEEELVSAAHDFMREARLAKAMHDGEGIGEVVESVVLTKELQKALGIEVNKVGWLIGMHVECNDAWAKFSDGTYAGFSIGGSAVREEIADA